MIQQITLVGNSKVTQVTFVIFNCKQNHMLNLSCSVLRYRERIHSGWQQFEHVPLFTKTLTKVTRVTFVVPQQWIMRLPLWLPVCVNRSNTKVVYSCLATNGLTAWIIGNMLLSIFVTICDAQIWPSQWSPYANVFPIDDIFSLGGAHNLELGTWSCLWV